MPGFHRPSHTLRYSVTTNIISELKIPCFTVWPKVLIQPTDLRFFIHKLTKFSCQYALKLNSDRIISTIFWQKSLVNYIIISCYSIYFQVTKVTRLREQIADKNFKKSNFGKLLLAKVTTLATTVINCDWILRKSSFHAQL